MLVVALKYGGVMKRLFLCGVFFFSLMTSSVFAAGIGMVTADTPIPENGNSAFEFRGNPSFGYAPLKEVYKAKTYGELRDALENFFTQWKKDGMVFEDSASTNMFYSCRLALIRTYYLLGESEKADTLLEWVHPVTLLDDTGFPQ